jgi:hypothetical protein
VTFDGGREHGLLMCALAIAHLETDLKTMARAPVAGYRQTCAKCDVLWLDAPGKGSPWPACVDRLRLRPAHGARSPANSPGGSSALARRLLRQHPAVGSVPLQPMISSTQCCASRNARSRLLGDGT